MSRLLVDGPMNFCCNKYPRLYYKTYRKYAEKKMEKIYLLIIFLNIIKISKRLVITRSLKKYFDRRKCTN